MDYKVPLTKTRSTRTGLIELNFFTHSWINNRLRFGYFQFFIERCLRSKITPHYVLTPDFRTYHSLLLLSSCAKQTLIAQRNLWLIASIFDRMHNFLYSNLQQKTVSLRYKSSYSKCLMPIFPTISTFVLKKSIA